MISWSKLAHSAGTRASKYVCIARGEVMRADTSRAHLEDRAICDASSGAGRQETLMLIDDAFTIRDHLDEHWSDWFDGLMITNRDALWVHTIDVLCPCRTLMQGDDICGR